MTTLAEKHWRQESREQGCSSCNSHHWNNVCFTDLPGAIIHPGYEFADRMLPFLHCNRSWRRWLQILVSALFLHGRRRYNSCASRISRVCILWVDRTPPENIFEIAPYSQDSVRFHDYSGVNNNSFIVLAYAQGYFFTCQLWSSYIVCSNACRIGL